MRRAGSVAGIGHAAPADGLDVAKPGADGIALRRQGNPTPSERDDMANPADLASAARSGRRPGNPDTRREILDSARKVFAANGFNKASIRRIAAGAGVDPALVHHYFGSKDELFLA